MRENESRKRKHGKVRNAYFSNTASCAMSFMERKDKNISSKDLNIEETDTFIYMYFKHTLYAQ